MVKIVKKVVLLSNGGSIHICQWANYLSSARLEVHVVTADSCLPSYAPNVFIHQLPFKGPAGYLLNFMAVRRLLKKISPCILNAHYASGYGTLARLSGFHPLLLSVWGSDVYSFPDKSFVHRILLSQNILASDLVASTSEAMGRRVRHICPSVGEPQITPFGVNLTKFAPRLRPKDSSSCIVIGTVRSLSVVYGIDVLIAAFAILYERLKSKSFDLADKLVLRIVGDGPERSRLVSLAHSLGVADLVEFIGALPHEAISAQLADFSVFVALSRQESFGVAVIEASAAGLPVVVAGVGGLPEVVIHGVTGFVVSPENAPAAADALYELVTRPDLRSDMGSKGRAYVSSKYSWASCVEKMLQTYSLCIARSSWRSAT